MRAKREAGGEGGSLFAAPAKFHTSSSLRAKFRHRRTLPTPDSFHRFLPFAPVCRFSPVVCHPLGNRTAGTARSWLGRSRGATSDGSTVHRSQFGVDHDHDANLRVVTSRFVPVGVGPDTRVIAIQKRNGIAEGMARRMASCMSCPRHVDITNPSSDLLAQHVVGRPELTPKGGCL